MYVYSCWREGRKLFKHNLLDYWKNFMRHLARTIMEDRGRISFMSDHMYRRRWSSTVKSIYLNVCSPYVICLTRKPYGILILLLWLLSMCFVTLSTAAQPFDLPPTMFITQPQAGSAEVQGNTKVLLCYASGVPPPVYRWKKNGKFLTTSSINDTSLKIQNIQRSDAGEYQCVASNSHGAILSNRVHVHVAYMVPFPKAGNQDQRVDQGRYKIINPPPIDSFPAPTLTWYEGQTIPIPTETQRYHVTLKHQLVILETRLSDNNKVFMAKAVNTYTGQNSASQIFVLNIQNVGSIVNDLGPEIVIPPSHTTAVQGEDAAVILECVANARPINYLSLDWYKKTGPDGRTKIAEDSVKYILSMYRRRLTIKNPVTDDEGTYQCVASFSRPGGVAFMPARAEANLTIYVKPNSANPPSEISQDVDTTVTIPCQSVGRPLPTVQWYRNAQTIQTMPGERYSIEPNGNLVIRDVKTEDTAMFQCFVNNDAGEVNAAVWVRVLSSVPDIVQKPQNLSLIAGDSARFPCDVTGAPRPNIWWYRVTSTGTENLPGGTGGYQVLSKELLIPVTGVSDSGQYFCNATNNKGVDVASAFLVVTERTRIVAPPQDASVILGSTTVLQCGATYSHDVIVTWYWFHDDTAIPRTDPRRQIKKDGSLEIRSVRSKDIGQYRCEIISQGGNDTAGAYINVIKLPEAPSIHPMTLSGGSNRAVNVKWTPNFNGNSPIRRFVVQYRLLPTGTDLLPDEGWLVADGNLAPTVQTYTVDNLQPARAYQFRVSAVNDVGEGPPSDPSDPIELPQQPPSGPPRGVVGSPRSNSSIIIQWQPPDKDKWNGHLLGYVIRFKPARYPDSTLQYDNITNYVVTMYELKRLIVFQEYEIAVAAYNKKGEGVYSNYIRVMTQEGIPTAPPTDVKAKPESSTSIMLTWLPPDPQYINGINQGYMLTGRQVNHPDPEIHVTIPSNTSNMLGIQTGYLVDLKKFTKYEITILCFTSKGDGPQSVSVKEKTLEDVPEEVGSLTFDNILDTSLRVIWTPPKNINGILTGYTLSYMKKNSTITRVTKNLNPTDLTFTIRGLTATTTYTIEVFARTVVGPGPARQADIDSGIPPEPPGPPRNLAITNIQTTSVLLQFVPGFNGHTSISRWIIQGQTLNSEPDTWTEVYTVSDPDSEALTVKNLMPYTDYRLRLIAENIAGRSDPSSITRWFQTIQAPPSQPPHEVTVRAVNETALRVRWTPLAPELWHGEQRGYRVQSKVHYEEDFTNTILLDDENANSYTLDGLEEWSEYDVRVGAVNQVGTSPYSAIATDRTRESVPSQGPANVTAEALSSTSIRVRWDDVPEAEQNGQIRGYKVQYDSAGVGYQVEIVHNSSVQYSVLTELKKFVHYDIRVLAYTRIGDGVPSIPPVVVRTHEDVPGPPSSIYFPEVTHTSVKIVWSAPSEPNGVITGYRVSYQEKSSPPFTIVDDSLGPGRRDFYVDGLEMNKYYQFTLTAKTSLGWGLPADVDVLTIINRRMPSPPGQPQIGPSQIGDRWVVITWQPGNDGYGPVRNFTIETQTGNEQFLPVAELVPHTVNSFNITKLRPNFQYQFRVAATNDIGTSDFSEPSDQVTTKQAAPESPPLNLRVIPQTTTSVLVTWQPAATDTWNGDPVGYEVWYAPLHYLLTGNNRNTYQQKTVMYPLTQLDLVDLVPDTNYEVKASAFNTIDLGPFTRPVDFYVGEAVPTAPPRSVHAQNKSSTEILVTWEPPPVAAQNGDLLGYKIFYWVTSTKSVGTKMKTVGATERQAVLSDLKIFTEYYVLILAFNAAGDGPNTTVPVKAKTNEGIPGMPGKITFTVTSLTSVNVSWLKPLEPNGQISLYEVSYYQAKFVDGESRSVQVKIPHNKTHYLARELTENVKYVFSVRARTSLDWGPHRDNNVTIGPQKGSPERPSKPWLVTGDTAVTIMWENGYRGDSDINAYIIQNREKAGEWESLIRKNSPEPEALISFYNLKPNTEYQFRVIAINKRGISAPSPASDFLRSFDVEQKPFYQQWWFLIIVALTGIIFIIVIISLLCLTGKLRSSKEPKVPRTTVQLSDNVVPDEGGFATFEMRQSQRQRQSQRKQPKRTDPLPPYAKSPPRPSPGSVNYSDDEAKGYADEDSSTCTEKPSEISSNGSPAYSQASDSDADSEKDLPLPPPPPSAFTNHYVNGDVRNSWKRQSSYNAYSYTDSEPSEHYAVSLNGGHIIMNNMAGSRAPLPGFSSFV